MKTLNFKYKNDYYLNILSALLFVILILVLIVIFKYVDTMINKLLFILLAFIFANIALVILGKIVGIVNGKITFDKHSFIYETLNNEYTINYNEIEYISREIYTDNTDFIKRENYSYIIKIKNAGYFVFKYYDDSLLEVIEELLDKAKQKIMD
jgi:hypothetical protein